jgi:CxxC motif-containing protein
MSKLPESMSAEMQLMAGMNIAIVHIFNCLNGKGVLPFSESIQSLEDTIEQLGDDCPRGAQIALESITAMLRIIESKADAPDPTKPPSPTRLH